MGGIVILLIAGLILYGIWYLFFKSVLWVAEPLIKHFDGKEAERFTIEEIIRDEIEDAELLKAPKEKVKLKIKDFDKPVHLPKSVLQKAQKEPQKIDKTDLWIYKDYIFPSKPTEEKIKEIFGIREQNT